MGVSYNGIDFSYCLTEINAAGAEMDPSGSDQLYTTIRLRVRSVLNPSLYPNLGVPLQTDPAATLAAIRHMLTAPRKPLYYDLLSPPGQRIGPAIIDIPDGRDDANGPVPDPDAFSAVYTTPSTIEVTWAVTVKLRDCDDGSTPTMPLSFRWESGIEFDKYFKATVRQTGHVIFSSKSQVSPDNFRRTSLAPAVLPGFAREQAHYKLAADGLRMDFEFVDGQIRYAPPYPIIDMDITQSESFPLPGGKRVGEITVLMRGTINAHPRDLEFWAMVVGWNRLLAADPIGDRNTGRLVGQAMFTMHEAKDAIDATFTISYLVDPTVPAQVRTGSSPNRWSNFFANPGLATFGVGLAGGTTAPVGPGGVVTNVAALANTVTQQGQITARNQPFPWVGVGTSQGATPAQTYASWAAPGRAMAGPDAGFPLASAVGLYAAALRDPCGGYAAVMPNAPNATFIGPLQIPSFWNTPAGGSAGPTQSNAAAVVASGAQFSAAMAPTTPAPSVTSGPYQADPRPGGYDLIQCVAEYFENRGVIVVPQTDPAGASIKIGFANPQFTMTLRFVARRVGSWPRIPLPDIPDLNWVLTNKTIPVRDMRVSADGVSYIYEASGVYEYMSLDPALVRMTAPVPPTLSTSRLARVANWADKAAVGQISGDAPAENPLPWGAGSFEGSGSSGGNVLTGGGSGPLGGNTLGNTRT